MSETFEEFKNSFSYGSRGNLNFKFMKFMSDEQASDFLQGLLHRVTEAYDTGDIDSIIDAAYEAQRFAYSPVGDFPHGYDDEVFAPLTKPLSECRVALLTSSGHFVHGDDPMPLGESHLTQAEAEARVGDFLRDTPVLSSIPADVDINDLDVRHPGYDIRSAQLDANVTFPVERLRDAVNAGRIGSLTEELLSFPGATSQGRLKKQLPEWVKRVQDLDADVVLLVPV